MTSRTRALIFVVLSPLLAGCAVADRETSHEEAVTQPPPEIRAWMDRLTVEHAYDPDTGFIVARETVALPRVLAGGPRLDEAVRLAAERDAVVVAFATADRCAPCQQYKMDALNDPRVVERLGDPRLVASHVEVDREPELAESRLGSRAIPVTYALRGGERVAVLRGQRSADELLAWLDGVLGQQP